MIGLFNLDAFRMPVLLPPPPLRVVGRLMLLVLPGWGRSDVIFGKPSNEPLADLSMTVALAFVDEEARRPVFPSILVIASTLLRLDDLASGSAVFPPPPLSIPDCPLTCTGVIFSGNG